MIRERVVRRHFPRQVEVLLSAFAFDILQCRVRGGEVLRVDAGQKLLFAASLVRRRRQLVGKEPVEALLEGRLFLGRLCQRQRQAAAQLVAVAVAQGGHGLRHC